MGLLWRLFKLTHWRLFPNNLTENDDGLATTIDNTLPWVSLNKRHKSPIGFFKGVMPVLFSVYDWWGEPVSEATQGNRPCLALLAAPKQFSKLRPRIFVIVDEFPRICRNILVCIYIFVMVLTVQNPMGLLWRLFKPTLHSPFPLWVNALAM